MAIWNPLTWFNQQQKPEKKIDPVFDDGMALPHVMTFNQVIGSGWAYWHDRWDEAMRKSREDALAMRRDCSLMGPLNERKLAVASLGWHLEIPDERNIAQKLIRDEVTKIIKGIRGLRRIIWSLLDALWYGRFAVQLLWNWEQSQGRRVLGVKQWRPHNGDKIGHGYDGTPYILTNGSYDLPGAEYVQTTQYRGLALRGSWRERFVIHAHEIEDADYWDAEMGERIHGVGIRDRVFFLDWIRKEWLGKITDFIDRVGLGVTVWYFTEGNPEEKSKVERAAREQSDRLNIVWPRSPHGKGTGSGIERLEVPVTGAQFLRDLQEYIDEKIERYIVGQTLSSKSEGSGLGGNGVADLHADTKSKIAAFDAGLLGETLTGSDDEPGLVNTIVRWSFPGIDFPMNWVFDVEKSESKEKLEAGKVLVDSGVPVKMDEFRAVGGFSKPGPNDEVVQPPAPQPSPFGGPDPAGSARSSAEGGPDQFRRTDAPFVYGRWLTIGAKDVGGEKKGGTPVYVENGRITKGHPKLTGKRIDALKEEAEPSSHRSELHQSKGYNRAVWAKKAKAEGVKPEHLHQLAGEVLAHDKEFKADLHSLQRRARDSYKSLAKYYGWQAKSIDNLATHTGRKGLDAASVKGLDSIADELAGEYPQWFSGHGEDLSGRLFELLAEGNPEPMAEDDAYQQAYGQLLEGVRAAAEDVVPFWRAEELFLYEQEYHGPNPPGEGWTQTGEGPRGGKIWKRRLAAAAGHSIEAFKHVGHQAVELEHAAKEWTTDRIEAAVGRLPAKVQAMVKGAWHAVRLATKTAFVTYQAGQAAAEAVARENGASADEARSLRAILSAVDIATLKPVQIGTALAAGPAVAGAVSFLPIGSLTYLAYSTARNPLATLKAARRLVRKVAGKPETYARRDDATLAGVLAGLKSAKDRDWYSALVLSALDQTQGLAEAMRLANRLVSIRMNQEQFRRADQLELYAYWSEQDHQRDEHGQFAQAAGEHLDKARAGLKDAKGRRDAHESVRDVKKSWQRAVKDHGRKASDRVVGAVQSKWGRQPEVARLIRSHVQEAVQDSFAGVDHTIDEILESVGHRDVKRSELLASIDEGFNANWGQAQEVFPDSMAVDLAIELASRWPGREGVERSIERSGSPTEAAQVLKERYRIDVSAEGAADLYDYAERVHDQYFGPAAEKAAQTIVDWLRESWPEESARSSAERYERWDESEHPRNEDGEFTTGSGTAKQRKRDKPYQAKASKALADARSEDQPHGLDHQAAAKLLKGTDHAAASNGKRWEHVSAVLTGGDWQDSTAAWDHHGTLGGLMPAGSKLDAKFNAKAKLVEKEPLRKIQDWVETGGPRAFLVFAQGDGVYCYFGFPKFGGGDRDDFYQQDMSLKGAARPFTDRAKPALGRYTGGDAVKIIDARTLDDFHRPAAIKTFRENLGAVMANVDWDGVEGQISEQEQKAADWLLKHQASKNPKAVAESLTVEQRMDGLTVEQRMDGLTVEQRMDGLTVEQLEAQLAKLKAGK